MYITNPLYRVCYLTYVKKHQTKNYVIQRILLDNKADIIQQIIMLNIIMLYIPPFQMVIAKAQ